MVIEIGTIEELFEEIKDGRKILFFYHDSPLCKEQLDYLEDFNGEHSDLDILKIDCIFNKDIADFFHINAVPAIITYIDNVESGNDSGLLKEKALFKFLSSALKY